MYVQTHTYTPAVLTVQLPNFVFIVFLFNHHHRFCLFRSKFTCGKSHNANIYFNRITIHIERNLRSNFIPARTNDGNYLQCMKRSVSCQGFLLINITGFPFLSEYMLLLSKIKMKTEWKIKLHWEITRRNDSNWNVPLLCCLFFFLRLLLVILYIFIIRSEFQAIFKSIWFTLNSFLYRLLVNWYNCSLSFCLTLLGQSNAEISGDLQQVSGANCTCFASQINGFSFCNPHSLERATKIKQNKNTSCIYLLFCI